MHPDETRSDAPCPAELASWLRRHALDPESFVALGGDVSPRTYARVRGARVRSARAPGVDDTSWIVASYPPEIEDSFHRFLRTTRLLEGAGVRVPAIRDADPETRRMVLEDLGAATLYELPPRPWPSWLGDYTAAADILGRIAGLPETAVAELSPVLDGAVLRRELVQSREVFFQPSGLLSAGLSDRLEAFFDDLCAAIDAQPRRPCHRDFMVRNLVPTAGGLAVLDHQDLRLGPAAYDLASLLNDSLFPPPEIETAVLAVAPAGSDPRIDYHRCAVQRTFKAVGTFAAFARRGSPRHLPLIPDTLARGLEHLRRLPEGAALAQELKPALAPALGSALA